jgi:outer membrane protein assembly factor BamB
MSANDRSAGSNRNPECDAIAPLLALRETDLLDAEEAARVERHLATCLACQRDAALDGALAGHLRRALLPGVQAAPALGALSTEEIMRATNARETAAVIGDAPGARPTEAERRGVHARSTAARWGGGLSAIAAVLALITFAAYIFGRFAPAGGTYPGPTSTVTPARSPLLAQQTVYLPTDVGVYALRASDGVVRWTYPDGIEATPVTHAQAIYGLAFDGATLYALAAASDNPSQDGAQLLALNASDGAVHWSQSIPGVGSASLLKVGDLLIVAPKGPAPTDAAQSAWTVEAFSATNGKQVWSRALDEAPLSNLASTGGSIFIGTPIHVIALNASNGAIRWTSGIVPGANQQGTTPATFNASVALAAADDGVFILAKRTITKGAATTWEANYFQLAAADGSHLMRDSFGNEPLETAFAPTPDGDIVLAPVFGQLMAISTYSTWAVTSAGDQWSFLPDGARLGHAMTGAAVSDGVVYITDLFGVKVSHNGVSSLETFTYAIRASNGAELWRAPTNGGLTASTPVAASGLVLAPSKGQVKALRAADGHQLWMFATPAGSAVGAPLLG